MDTFRALAPPQGMKFRQLFAEPAGNADARMQRLEKEVQSLRNDLDTVVPSIVRLVAVEKDMKDLIGQLKTLTDEQQGGGPAVAATPPPLPVMEQALEAKTAQPEQQNSPEASRQPEQAIPGEDDAGGTETAKDEKKADQKASSSLVTPEAASEGELPPEGAASPSSRPVPEKASPPPAKAAPQQEKKAEAAPPPAAVAQPAAEKPAAEKPAAEKPAAQKPAASGAGAVNDVRVGDHPGMTRLVLDLSARTSFTATLGNKGKTLVIDMPGADWAKIKPFEADSAALVSGWHVEGQKLVVDLLYPSTIKAQDMISPNGSPWYRLVVDLFSPDVHDQ